MHIFEYFIYLWGKLFEMLYLFSFQESVVPYHNDFFKFELTVLVDTYVATKIGHNFQKSASELEILSEI